MIFAAALRPPARNRLSATANRRFGAYHCDRLPDRVRRSEGSRRLSVQSRPELHAHIQPSSHARTVADLIAFGTLFLANSDPLPRPRITALHDVSDRATFYAGEDKGFSAIRLWAHVDTRDYQGTFHENSMPRIDAE